MSYQLYVTGGYGFTERVLPSLLHPSDAVSIAQDYFSRGYQGAHIEPPPDGGYRALEQSSSSERQAILDALQSGQLVLGRLDSAAFGIFTDRTASPEHLRSDLPAPLANRLRDRWPSGAIGGPAVRSDSLHAPATQDYPLIPEPVAEPVPGQGPYSLTIEYRWPDGTGVANLPFEVGTDLESVTGVLDHRGAASVEGLNSRFATVRLGSNRHGLQIKVTEPIAGTKASTACMTTSVGSVGCEQLGSRPPTSAGKTLQKPMSWPVWL